VKSLAITGLLGFIAAVGATLSLDTPPIRAIEVGVFVACTAVLLHRALRAAGDTGPRSYNP
jgi:hypothetical protein